MKINVTKEANNNIREIALYIAESTSSKTTAKQALSKIEHSLTHISTMPELGHTGQRKNTRELIMAHLPYIIVYQIKKTSIDILAVTHSSRNR
jgi:toxin ParE1/3/4